MRDGSRFTRLLHRFTATDDELEAEELRDQVTAAGAKPVVVFLGRRRIVGIETGRSVAVYGRLTFHGSRPTMFNPRYEFLSAEAGVG